MLGTAGLPALEGTVPKGLAAFLAFVIEGVHRLSLSPASPELHALWSSRLPMLVGLMWVLPVAT